jgi:hypothetical protein
VTPSGSPYPLPPGPDPLPLVVLFVGVLVVTSAFLWWQVLRAVRQRRRQERGRYDDD